MNFGAAAPSGSGRPAAGQMDWSVANLNAFKTFNNKDMEPKSSMDMAIIRNADDSVDVGLGSSEKGDAGGEVPGKRKKTMTSVYLKYFETAPDGKSRRCKYCAQSYSIATATGNLGRHLNNRHPGYDKSVDSVTVAASQPPAAVVKKAQPQSQGKAKVDYDHLNWLLVKWIVVSSVPPATIEEKWLANSFRFLNPSIQLWSGLKYKEVLREVFRSMQEDVRVAMEQVSSKVSVSLDFWTNYEQIFYMSVTCQWIDDNWCCRKMLLDVCRVPYPSGGAEIYHCLTNVLKMYNIENKVLSCTHDNSQNAIHACHTLKEDLDGQKVGPFCFIPCTARALSLIIDDGLRTTKPVISKIRELALELNSSLEMSDDFIRSTTAFQEGTWRFPLETSSRWSGNYQMLDLVRKAGKSIDSVIRKYEDTFRGRMLLTSAEKNAVSIVHGYLEPFYKATTNICTSKFLTVGLVLFFMDHISEMITLCRESRHSPDWLKNAAEDMAKKAKSHGSQVCNIFTYMTAILDPRIKRDLIPESLGSGSYLEDARSHFLTNYSGHFSSMTSGYSIQDNEDGGSVSFAEEIARKKRRGNLSSSTDELTQYLSEPPAPIPTDVLEWWKANCTRYPRLSVMARDFLAVQPTSVSPEELFCSKGDEVDRQRLCMPYDSAQAILCVRSWTRAGIGLKYKSTVIDYERLMELAAPCAIDNTAVGSDKKQK